MDPLHQSHDVYFHIRILIDTLAKGVAHYQSLGAEYPVRLAIMLVLCGVAAWTANRRFHLLFAALYLVYLLSWILSAYRVLI